MRHRTKHLGVGARSSLLVAGAMATALVLAACGAQEAPPVEEPAPVEDEPADAEEGPEEAVEEEEGPLAHFAGETITLVVPYSTGGGYDVYLRMLAPHLDAAGGVTTVVDNQEGAGGLQAANSLFAATGDPHRIMIANGPGFSSAWLVGDEGVRFEMNEFTALGRMVSEPHVLGVSADSTVADFDELVEAGSFSWGVTGPGSTAGINAVVLADVFGLDVDVVSGFEGSGEIQTALLRGDIDVMSIEPSSGLAAIEAGEFVPLVYLSNERSDLLPDVPALGERDLDDTQTSLLSAHFALFEVGRALLAPPGLDAADVAALRALVETAMSDPDLVAAFEADNRPLAFIPGDALEELLDSLAQAPPAYVALLQQATD